jgi:putative chitinase
VFAKHKITSPLLVAHVMAQISHECGAGHDVVENLNYTAGRMMQVWPSRFPSMASAEPYAGNPRALANKVYNGRMGNRAGSDDGWTFRGRGASQTTGREGYERVRKATGLDVVAHPEWLIDPRYFLLCGVSDFVNCGCLPFAQADDVLNVTRRLNGGTIGLAQRKAWLTKWKAALGDQPVVLASSPPLAPTLPASRQPEPANAPAAAPSTVSRIIAALAAAFRRA